MRPAISLACLLAIWLAPHRTFAAASAVPGPTLASARALYAAGDVAGAVAAFRAVAAASEVPADAATARNNACVLAMELGEHRQALADCRAALAIRRSEDGLGAEDGRRALARTLNNLGLALQNTGDYAASSRRLGEALAINRDRGDAQAEAVNLDNLGGTATLAGRYESARAYHREAAALAARHRDQPWAASLARTARLNEAVVLEHLGAYREALVEYREVLSAAAELDPRDRATLEVNVGVIYRNLGDPVTALRYFGVAEESYRRLGDTSGLAHAALNAALAQHLGFSRTRTAEGEYRRALALAEEAGDRPREIEVLFYLGGLLREIGRLAEAEAIYLRALSAAETSGSPTGRWAAREGLGRVMELRGEPRAALEHLEVALDEIEAVRAGLSRGEVRSGFFGAQRPAYAATVRVLARLHRDEPDSGWDARALEVVQRAKSRELLESLATSGEAPDRPLAAGELIRRAGQGVTIEYFLGERELYRWWIGGGWIELTELGDPAELLAAVSRLHGELAGGRSTAEGEPAVLLDRLSRGLLSGLPAGRRIGGGAGALRIAPEGRLAYLPFELLTPPGDEQPLVRSAEVTYLPSASALGRPDEPSAARGGEWTWVGFGNPELPPDARLVADLELGPLPGAERELAAIAAALPGPHRVELGAAATEAALVDALAQGTKVLHLATHTALDERPGRGAAIVLAAGGGRDGLLRPEEVAELPSGPQLAVLAACRTALGPAPVGTEPLGPSQDARALSSLTGAFLAAGSGAVLATLWDVDDAATGVFMEQLYHHLGNGLAPAAALRRAKLRLADDPRWDDPSVWAAYVLIGEAPPLVGAVRAGRLRRWTARAAWAAAALFLAAALFALWTAGSATRTRSRR